MLAGADDHLATFSFSGVSQTVVKHSTLGQCPQVLAGTARKVAKSTRLCSYTVSASPRKIGKNSRRPHLVCIFLGFKMWRSRGREGKTKEEEGKQEKEEETLKRERPHPFGGGFSWPILTIKLGNNWGFWPNIAHQLRSLELSPKKLPEK